MGIARCPRIHKSHRTSFLTSLTGMRVTLEERKTGMESLNALLAMSNPFIALLDGLGEAANSRQEFTLISFIALYYIRNNLFLSVITLSRLLFQHAFWHPALSSIH